MYTGVYKDNVLVATGLIFRFNIDKKIAIIILYVLFTQRSYDGL